MSVKHRTGVALVALLIPLSALAHAQVVREHTSGLRAPVGLTALPDGNVLVAEAGMGPNTGRVSVVDRDARRFTIIDALPSGFHGPGNDPTGPSSVLLMGRRLYILIGNGDISIAAAGGIERLNPSPSSPLFASVLMLEFLSDAPRIPLGFSMSPAAHAALAAGRGVYLTNVDGETARLGRLVALPPPIAEPRPDVPDNVRISNPFGMTGNDARLDIVDAARNLVWSVRINTREPQILAMLPPVPNTLAPMGPPVVEPVPASIRGFRDALLVSYLTGFPFGPGAARVVSINRHTGEVTPVILGLRTAIDVLPVTRGRGLFYVLEYSTDFLAGAPGRLLLVEDPDRPPLVLAEGLQGPTNMATDVRTGDLFVSEIKTGRIMRVLVP